MKDRHHMQFYYAHILCMFTVDASQANDTNKLFTIYVLQ